MNAPAIWPFAMGNMLQELLFQKDAPPKTSRRECMLEELLCIPDSEKSPNTKIDLWKKLLGCSLNKKHPEVYLEDVMRSCWKVNGSIFNVEPNAVDKSLRMQSIDNAILSMLNVLHSPLTHETDDLHLLRYLVQDLMNQLIFVLDPSFPTRHNDILLQKGRLLINSGDDYAVFSLNCKESTLSLSALQYWKVVESKSPSNVLGYDAQRIDITINLANATRPTLLDCMKSASCVMQFSGLSETVQEL